MKNSYNKLGNMMMMMMRVKIIYGVIL